MKPATDLTGRTYGRLIVIAREGSTERKPRRPLWRCRCECGRDIVTLAASLRSGRTQSCGCFRAELARAVVSAARAQRWASSAPQPNTEGIP